MRIASLGWPGGRVAGGTYPGETLRTPPKTGIGKVLFRPSPGARVFLGDFRAEGQSNFELRDVVTNTWYLLRVSNVTIRNVRTRLFFIRTSKFVQVLGGDVGGIQVAASPTIGTKKRAIRPQYYH